MPRRKSTHVDDPSAVGRRLRDAREAAGLSQRRLAFPGCSPAYISRIEAGERIPSLQLLRELARRLGVTEDYLATGGEADSPGAAQKLVEAEIALRLGDAGAASALYDEALHEAVDDGGRSDALEGLGNVALRAGRPDEARRLFARSLELSGASDCDRPTLAASLAAAYRALGEVTAAIAILRRCVGRFEREGDKVLYVRFACLLGEALAGAGDAAAAERVVVNALRLRAELADPLARARVYWSHSRLLGERGRSNGSARYAALALETLRAREETYDHALAHRALAQAYLDGGRAGEAAEVLEDGRALAATAGRSLDLDVHEPARAQQLYEPSTDGRPAHPGRQASAEDVVATGPMG